MLIFHCFHAFTENENIADYSIQYLSVCMIFCGGSLLSTMFQRFLPAVGDTFYSMLSLAATVIFMVFPSELLRLFSPGDEMVVIGVPAFRIISVTFVFSSVTMILGYSMSGLGNGFINMLGTALRQLIIFVPLAYLFAIIFGIERVWYSMWISETDAMFYAIYASRNTLRKCGI